jgi:hypothetical protein
MTAVNDRTREGLALLAVRLLDVPVVEWSKDPTYGTLADDERELLGLVALIDQGERLLCELSSYRSPVTVYAVAARLGRDELELIALASAGLAAALAGEDHRLARAHDLWTLARSGVAEAVAS